MGFGFASDAILLAALRHLEYGLFCRDVEERLSECCSAAARVTICRWVRCFTPLLIDAARSCQHAVGGRRFVDGTYVKAGGKWRYIYRAVDQQGRVIGVFVSQRCNIRPAREFRDMAMTLIIAPDGVVTDLAKTLETANEMEVPDVLTTPGSMPTTDSNVIMVSSKLGVAE